MQYCLAQPGHNDRKGEEPMTKKHFQKIATILKSSNVSNEQRLQLANEFAGLCREVNPRFDTTRFINAVMVWS
jgi:uncharacterized protein YciW